MNEPKRKILIIGTPPGEADMATITAYAEKYAAAIEYQPEPVENEEPGVYKVNFPKPPPRIMSHIAGVSLLIEMSAIMSASIAYDLPPMPSPGKSKMSKARYSRSKTQAELDEPKLKRNQPCHCGSGLKYKKCHGKNKR